MFESFLDKRLVKPSIRHTRTNLPQLLSQLGGGQLPARLELRRVLLLAHENRQGTAALRQNDGPVSARNVLCEAPEPVARLYEGEHRLRAGHRARILLDYSLCRTRRHRQGFPGLETDWTR